MSKWQEKTSLCNNIRDGQWTKKQDPATCCFQETHLIGKDSHRLKVKGWGKPMQMGVQKEAGVAILIPNKPDFKHKLIIRDKEDYYILVKGIIQQEHIAIVNIFH